VPTPRKLRDTIQVVGYVAITAADNPNIRDTSDRERLEDNIAAKEFKSLLQAIVIRLEAERSKDRKDDARTEQPFQDLFTQLSPTSLVNSVSEAAARGANASEIVPLVEDYGAKVQETVNQIERRLVYYSRLASLGVLSALIVHEVRNHTFVIGGLTRSIRKMVDAHDPITTKIEKDLRHAEGGIRSLERLADTFAPLASRSSRTRRRDSNLEEIIQECVAMRDIEIRNKKVAVNIESQTQTIVAIDPGEITAIIINLLDNALYWIGFIADRPREIQFCVSSLEDHSRVYVQVDDSGPGVRSGEEERIFWPGVTNRPEGLGMGLTVAAEIVAQHGGNMRLVTPGVLKGASFGFDLPIARRHI
jgi:C4-dicarboxylate-specific signal transduction histidine kinase